MVQRPHRSLPAPERPRGTQAKFPPEGPAGGCGGKAQRGGPWAPPPPSGTAPACSNRSQPPPPARRLPAPLGSGAVQPAGSRSPAPSPPSPLTAPVSPGSVPGPAPPGRSCPDPDGRTDGRTRRLPTLAPLRDAAARLGQARQLRGPWPAVPRPWRTRKLCGRLHGAGPGAHGLRSPPSVS